MIDWLPYFNVAVSSDLDIYKCTYLVLISLYHASDMWQTFEYINYINFSNKGSDLSITLNIEELNYEVKEEKKIHSIYVLLNWEGI